MDTYFLDEIDYTKLSRDYRKEPVVPKEIPPKDDILYVYIECNLSLAQSPYAFGNITRNRFITWLHHYSIKKDLNLAKQRAKKTCMKKYGTNFSSQSSVIRDKLSAAWKRKSKDEIREIVNKREETCVDKYGVAHPAQNETIKQKAHNSYNAHTDEEKKEWVEKAKRTTLERYGVEHANQSLQIKTKIKEKWQNKTKQDVDAIIQKRKLTNIEKYGQANTQNLKAVLDKTKQTNLIKRGVEWPTQDKTVIEKRRQTNLQKWGTINIGNSHISPEVLAIINNKQEFIRYIKANLAVPTYYRLAEMLGVSYSCVNKKAHEYQITDMFDKYTSTYEIELKTLFTNKFFKSRAELFPLEIDLYNKELKFGIEFNGDYWHCEKHKEKLYHQNKLKLAAEKGISLYNIFEYEWKDLRKRPIIISQIQSRLGVNRKVYARRCTIKELDSLACSAFLQSNHIQGTCGSKIKIGLYENDELVAVMTFGKPRFNEKYEYELVRFCCKCGCTVIGGASKLFSYFIKTYKPNSIISYCNLSKGTGNLYKILGFNYVKTTEPNYVWWHRDTILSRYECQKHKLLEMFPTADASLSEADILHSLDFYRIYDCGNSVWECGFIERKI